MSGKKYVVESAFESISVQKIMQIAIDANGRIVNWTDSAENIKELNSDYINEHFGQLQDEAYQRGLEEGKKATWKLVADASNAEYQKGLNDAWECARKIADMWETMDNDELLETFGVTARIGESVFGTLFKKQTANEAMLNLEAYEEQKADDEIKVGDEVRLCRHKVPYIVTSCDGDDDTYILMTVKGEFIRAGKDIVRKTGKHYDIDKILEEMNE